MGPNALPAPACIPDVGQHLTDPKKSVLLATNMTVAVGGPGPLPPGCDARHIVPAAENRSWAKDCATKAREILAAFNIDINDAVNGVYLPSPKKNRPAPHRQGIQRSKLHTKDHCEGLARELIKAQPDGCGSDGVRGVLRRYREQLENGVLPK